MEAVRWGGFFSSVHCQGGHRLGLAPQMNDTSEGLVDVVLDDERLVVVYVDVQFPEQQAVVSSPPIA